MTRISEAVECLESLGYTVTPPGRDAVDYKAETERLIRFAQDSGSVSAATAAVATATLYAAEQQRIASLIAVAFADANIFDTLSEGSPFVPVFAEIREGLGLS